ncbi:MAG: hypothetical protein JWO67_927 [Streptosporangiaceae bacterium]|nr:hypothetical protein [Streptosporangiaceae bacterium]
MITIRHSHADGTLIEGSRRGDGIFEILRGLGDNWRWMPSIGRIGIRQSRDRVAQRGRIERAAAALRAAGHEVAVEIDESDRRSFADAEADRYDRAEDRAEYHGDVAGRARQAADAAYGAEDGILKHIPPGQPILVGHHSEGRHRRDLARADAHRRRGRDEVDRSRYHEGRADAAASYQAGRESIPTTQRRIAKLEAEERQLTRRLNGTGLALHGEDAPASGAYAERLRVRLADIAEELVYWREHVAAAEAAGVKVWSRADFTRGDFVRFLGKWYEVLRVNGKSVTIPAMISDGLVVTRDNTRLSWTDTVPYDKVTGRKSAEEIAALLAEAGRRAEVAS